MRDATPELQDAVAQARDGVWGALEDWQNTTRTTAQVHRDLNSALDALIAAVREADFAAAERYAHTAMQAGGPLLDNLARAYLALLAHLKPPLNNTAAEVKSEINAAVSRPAEARGEPSEAMVEAAIAEFCSQTGDSYAMLMANASDEDKAEMRDDWRHILRAALAAQREQTP